MIAEAHRHPHYSPRYQARQHHNQRRGQAKVLDFGLAKFAENIDAKTNRHCRTVKQIGRDYGNSSYMSPEQVLANRLDARTDIFSFGAYALRMSCGSQPFARDTDAETISAILRDEPSWADIPAELQPIVQKVVLMKNADERYQAAKDLLVDCRSAEEFGKGRRAPDLARKFEDLACKRQITGVQTDTTVTQPRSALEYLAPNQRHKLAAAAVIVVLLLAPIAVVFLRSDAQAVAKTEWLSQSPYCHSKRSTRKQTTSILDWHSRLHHCENQPD